MYLAFIHWLSAVAALVSSRTCYGTLVLSDHFLQVKNEHTAATSFFTFTLSTAASCIAAQVCDAIKPGAYTIAGQKNQLSFLLPFTLVKFSFTSAHKVNPAGTLLPLSL